MLVVAVLMVAAGCASAARPPAPAAAGPSGAASATPAAASPAGSTVAASPPAAAVVRPSRPPELATIGIPAKSLNYLPLYLGHERGIFAEEGIDLQITVMQTELSIAGLLSGSLDYSGASTGAIGAAVAGADTRAIGFISIQPTFYIMSKPEIRSMAALRQKIIATTTPGASATEIARLAVRQFGLDPADDVQLLSTGTTANAYTALLSGQVDAALLSIPYNAQAEREGFYPLLYAGDVTNSPESGVAATTTRLRANPDQVKRVLRGVLRSTAYITAHQAETSDLIGREFDVAPELVAAVYDTVVRGYSKDGGIPPDAIANIIRAHRAETGVTREVTVEDVTDFGLLRDVQRELGLARS
jgi:NitT/TauT family transport system substrate-binding protein